MTARLNQRQTMLVDCLIERLRQGPPLNNYEFRVIVWLAELLDLGNIELLKNRIIA